MKNDKWDTQMSEILSNPKYYEENMTNFDKAHPKTKDSILAGTLYHGTDIRNLKNICKKGLKRGDACHVGDISARDPMIGSDRIYDCIGNVSLARDRKDAIFFASAHGKDPRASEGQVIFYINPEKLNLRRLYLRDIFGKKNREAKYLSDIPLNAIEKILIRKFDWSDGLEVTEKIVTPKEVCNSKNREHPHRRNKRCGVMK